MIPAGVARRGSVADFDPDAGYGHLVDADGDRWWFHCTAVADGSRHVDPGTVVRFRLVPGRRGRYEGADVTPA